MEEEKEIFNTKVKIKLNLHVETYQILHKCLYYFIQASSIFEFGDNVELCHNIINRLEENAIYKKEKTEIMLCVDSNEYDILHKAIYCYIVTASLFEYGESAEECHYLLYQLNKNVENYV